LRLVVAASGQLVASNVVRGSGLEALDQAALGMVRRARLPPLPAAMAPGPVSFTVPIVFALR
jgi:TonB family protein